MGEDHGSRKADQGTAPNQLDPAVPRKSARAKWPYLLLGSLVVVPGLLFTAWTVIALNWNYSDGTRPGYLQKFSRKGWLCKTWEGELAMVNMPGAAQERWSFSVRDDSVAAQIQRSIGARVALSYAQHRGVPGTCFGETEYFVTAVKMLP